MKATKMCLSKVGIPNICCHVWDISHVQTAQINKHISNNVEKSFDVDLHLTQ